MFCVSKQCKTALQCHYLCSALYKLNFSKFNSIYIKTVKIRNGKKSALNKNTNARGEELRVVGNCGHFIANSKIPTAQRVTFKNKSALDYQNNVQRLLPLLTLPKYNDVQINHYSTSASPSELHEHPSIFGLKAKQTLHNCFAHVSVELNQKELKVAPQYKLLQQDKANTWMCSYKLQWPEQIIFSKTAATKQEAATKAAEAALVWLKQMKRINKTGQPVIYDKKEVTQLIKQNYPCIKVDDSVKKELNAVADIYEKQFASQLVEDFSNENEVVNGVGNEEWKERWPEDSFTNRMRNQHVLDYYTLKEAVELPISKYRENIVEMLKKNRVLIIKGEPGCGKSTRVPQYILDDWARSEECNDKPCRIVVTEPRRIAAISLAERVADERVESVGNIVGYKVRLNSNFNQHTGRIMYCTTGILLRQLQRDPRLTDCSHVILDEAHERDVNIDLLMNLLKNSIEMNPNLKLLVMSATLETNLFQNYFNNAPVLHIPGFTYPIQKRFLEDKVMLAQDLNKTRQMCAGPHPAVMHEDVVSTIKFIHRNRPDGAILCFLPGWEDITKVQKLLPPRNDMLVLCLHSKLQVVDQRKIFNNPPHGVRKVILSTNIAETSVTINDVAYVIDTGIHKEEHFDASKGVSCIDNHWISQASAIQRSGRAGRCQAGECFHLYPESKFKDFEKYSIPEILRTSLTKIVLDSKVYSNDMNAEEFLQKLICPPAKNTIENAVTELKELELLDENEKLTPLGRKISDFQLSPKLARAMVNSVIFKCVTPVVDIATLFSADTSLFAKALVDKGGIKDIKKSFSICSDHIAMMNLFEKWLEYLDTGSMGRAMDFCDKTGLVHHKLLTIQKLRQIHMGYLYHGLSNALPIADDFSDNNEIVKAVILSGVGTILQPRNWTVSQNRLKKANTVVTRHNQIATITSESVNSRKLNFASNFLVYINETVSNLRHTTLVRETSLISALAVLLFKKGNLAIETLQETNFSDKLLSNDQVLLSLQGSKIKVICDREQAEAIKRCKEALQGGVEYYIYQLTKGNTLNEDLNEHWQQILEHLNNILNNPEVDMQYH